MSNRIETFKDRYPLVGPTFWMLSIQYYLTQVLVALDWSHPYGLRQNTISDLGNTVCGAYRDRMVVCSPLHNWMNASFVVLGITMVAGSTLVYQEFHKSRTSALGFTMMAIAGIGTAMVGLFPENTVAALHEWGAAMPFVVGNIALVVFGCALDMPRKLRVYTLGSGIIALAALGFFFTHTYLGLGIGGMERIVAYPQTIWLIVFGMYISRNHFRQKWRRA